MALGLPNPGGLLPLPGIDLPDVPLPSIPNPFDMVLDRFRELIHDWKNSAFEFIIETYVNAPRPDNGVFSYYLGNSLGLASMLIFPIITFTILWMIVRPYRSVTFIQSVFVAILFGLLAPGWLGLADSFEAASIQAADAIDTGPIKTPRGGPDLIFFPDISNILADITGVIVILVLGGILAFEAFWFGLLAVLVKIAAPLGLILYPLTEATKKIGNWLIAIGIVSLFAAVPLGKLGLVIGAIAANHGPLSNTSFGQIAYIGSGFVIAMALPIWAIFVLHNKVVKVAGALGARVHGGVDAMLKQRRPINTRQVTEANRAAMRIPGGTAKPSVARRARSDVIQSGVTVMSGKPLSSAIGKVTPATAATIAAGSAIQRHRQRRIQRGGDTPS